MVGSEWCAISPSPHASCITCHFHLDKTARPARPSHELMSAAELERLYDTHADALFAFLLNLTRDGVDARDALQEVFRKLTARPALLRGVRDERGFLLRLAHNLA